MSTIKCPSCGGDMPSIARVCEYCGALVNQDSSDSITTLTTEIEKKLTELKQIPIPGIWSSFMRNSKISMPVFTVVSFILAYKVSDYFIIAGLVFMIYSLVSLFRKRKPSPLSAFPSLKAEFETLSSKVNTLYGNDLNAKKVLSNFKTEVDRIETGIKKGRRTELLAYGIILLLLSVAWLIPEPASVEDKALIELNEDASTVQKIEAMINKGDIDMAKAALKDVKSPINQVIIQSKMQLQIRKEEMKKANTLIKEENFKAAAECLDALHWVKISQEYDYDSIEKEYFMEFISKKGEINNRLPEENKVKIETELDFN
jgi:hypothetical protein